MGKLNLKAIKFVNAIKVLQNESDKTLRSTKD